jgi:pimeloyl-ACP methyl ester carboxylesterase/DNA-binding CsgD family transcriptional regulator
MDAPPVQYVRTSDGFDIAYAVSGDGEPLILLPPALSNIQLAWAHFPQWLEGFAARFRLIQYDMRGEGLSQRRLPAGTRVTDFVRDLEAVVDHLGVQGSLLWAGGSRCHHAIRYAHDHPEKVRGLILNTCAVTGWNSSRMNELPNENWDLFLRALAPFDLSGEARRKRVDDMRRCMIPEDWAMMMSCYRASDVEHELTQLRVPALVMHPRDWPSLPAEASIKVAALIPDSRFVLLEGESVYGDTAGGLRAIDEFVASLTLDKGSGDVSTPSSSEKLSARELEVLRLIAAGRSNARIAGELAISLSTVAKHVTSILSKTGTANRTEAATYAHHHHLV